MRQSVQLRQEDWEEVISEVLRVPSSLSGFRIRNHVEWRVPGFSCGKGTLHLAACGEWIITIESGDITEYRVVS
jgi:hypothetical protein